MNRMHRNPAIWAGVISGIVTATPTMAQAATATASATSPLADAVPPFAFGCLTGAAFAGAIAYVVNDRSEPERNAAAVEGRRSASSVPDKSQVVPQARHASRAHAQADWEHTGEIFVRSVSEQASGSHFAPAGPSKHVNAEPTAASRRVMAEHVAHDYEDVAENYVRRQNFSERMAARAQGVADILSERIGATAMEGVPIIKRADGSTGDLGDIRWEDLMESDVHETSRPTAKPQEQPAPFMPVDDFDTPFEFKRVEVINPEIPIQRANVPTRAERIAKSLADIDQSVYPEKDTGKVEMNEQKDMWAQALEALDEKVSAPVDDVEDIIDGVDTLDEPDGLELDTRFIPFRTPAGHPEVVDTESYVDYLIGDEFSHNQSVSARRSSREYLRVIDGGTHKMKHLARPKSPRHEMHLEAREA